MILLHMRARKEAETIVISCRNEKKAKVFSLFAEKRVYFSVSFKMTKWVKMLF